MWERNKGTTKCGKTTVTSDVGTAQCENDTIKCEKNTDKCDIGTA